MDLSSPGEASVNDDINPDEFTLHYNTVDQVICQVSKFGKEAKFDVEAGYRNVPVHPSHCYLLGMKWCNHFYMDLALPSIADMLEWILVTSYKMLDLLLYLDDFITAGPPKLPGVCIT